MSEPYFVSRKEVDKQYRPRGYGLSPGLQRARAPFRTKNTITGLAIGSFVVGVWAYSISAVKQDTFEDLDDEAKALLAARLAAEDEKAKEKEKVGVATTSTGTVGVAASGVGVVGAAVGTGAGVNPGSSSRSRESVLVSSTPGPVRGLLASQLSKRFPSILDPQTGSLVWGAPPVDRIGRLGDKNDRPQ
ncbi:hypothetical protein PNOK_0368000 [Pyrrhoderma noxium]|uniref:Cytochrome c oxidase assembly factor 3 n=1 Tax=Pyrrhoderma noxium TaxID=2282107 RepID=A0A286UN83_9AGAM|nr:hypothetical protein PNOK_0368000 [Pyrrhoderma noxium]